VGSEPGCPGCTGREAAAGVPAVKLHTVGLAAAGLAAGYAAERMLLGRPRHRPDPEQLESFRPPPQALHRHVATDDDGEVHVVETGAGSGGRPLVLLHGITLSTLSWHYQLADLSDRFRVLAVDHRGHGQSRAGTAAWSIDRLACDLVHVLEDLDLRHAVVVGHSMGGMTALRFAIDHPRVVAERVAGMVLMSTAASPVHRLAAWKALTRVVTPRATRGLALAERARGGLFPTNDLSHLVFRLGMGKGASPTLIELNRLMTAATPVSVWGELLSGVIGFDVIDALHELTVPAVVFVGTADLLTPPAAARKLVDALPEARPLELFEGAGHMLMLERREEVNERIERFVASLPAPSGAGTAAAGGP